MASVVLISNDNLSFLLTFAEISIIILTFALYERVTKLCLVHFCPYV